MKEWRCLDGSFVVRISLQESTAHTDTNLEDDFVALFGPQVVLELSIGPRRAASSRGCILDVDDELLLPLFHTRSMKEQTWSRALSLLRI